MPSHNRALAKSRKIAKSMTPDMTSVANPRPPSTIGTIFTWVISFPGKLVHTLKGSSADTNAENQQNWKPIAYLKSLRNGIKRRMVNPFKTRITSWPPTPPSRPEPSSAFADTFKTPGSRKRARSPSPETFTTPITKPKTIRPESQILIAYERFGNDKLDEELTASELKIRKSLREAYVYESRGEAIPRAINRTIDPYLQSLRSEVQNPFGLPTPPATEKKRHNLRSIEADRDSLEVEAQPYIRTSQSARRLDRSRSGSKSGGSRSSSRGISSSSMNASIKRSRDSTRGNSPAGGSEAEVPPEGETQSSVETQEGNAFILSEDSEDEGMDDDQGLGSSEAATYPEDIRSEEGASEASSEVHQEDIEVEENGSQVERPDVTLVEQDEAGEIPITESNDEDVQMAEDLNDIKITVLIAYSIPGLPGSTIFGEYGELLLGPTQNLEEMRPTPEDPFIAARSIRDPTDDHSYQHNPTIPTFVIPGLILPPGDSVNFFEWTCVYCTLSTSNSRSKCDNCGGTRVRQPMWGMPAIPERPEVPLGNEHGESLLRRCIVQ